MSSEQVSPVPPYAQREPHVGEDSVPQLDGTPLIPDLELPASVPNRESITPELSPQEAPRRGRAELSPVPERLLINVDRRISIPPPIARTHISTMSESSVLSSPSNVDDAERSPMHLNLSLLDQ